MKHILSFCLALFATAPLLQAQNPCPNPPVVTIAVDDDTPCSGDAVTLTASGAATYSWTNNVENGVAFTPSTSETYQVVGTDLNGCTASASILVDVLPLPDLVANSSSLSICQGESVQLTASGAQSYTWIEPAINNGDFYEPTTTGANVYIVEGEGANGCVNTSQVIVVVKAIPEQPTLNTASISTCLDVAFDDEIEANVTEGRAIWYRDEALTEEHSIEPILPVRNNAVGVTNYYASNFEGGCFSAPVTASVEVFALPQIEAGEEFTATAGDLVSLNGQAPDDTDVEWTPESGLSDPFSLDPQFTATNSVVYTMAVRNGNSCESFDRVLVNVRNELIISNVLTANGDGDNDVWKIYPEVVLQTCDIKLYDGFGRLLLETNNYQNDWDGTYEGGSLPDGDYYYQIECDGVTEKGTLVIIN